MRVARVAWANLSAEARGLFGGAFFSTLFWYETVVAAALPAGVSADFLCIEQDGSVAAVLPMQRRAGRMGSLTTPYTCLWQPLLAAGCDVGAVGAALGPFCHSHPVRLDALDLCVPAWKGLLAGVRGAGIFPVPFAHFGNWTFPDAACGWDAYLASRPGNLREAIRRRTKKLVSAGAEFRIIDGVDEVEGGISAYESTYTESWKPAESFPVFNPLLMRACAAAGCLRLGILSLDGRALAVQFWVMFDSTAMVLKLAHLSSADRWSPGTVLTGMMIRHVMSHDHAQLIDFGRGDDGYKKLWTSRRQQRSGLILADRRTSAGAYEIVKHAVRRMLLRGADDAGG